MSSVAAIFACAESSASFPRLRGKKTPCTCRFSRPIVGLLLALGLLASACFPVAAYAETVYEPEATTIPHESHTAHSSLAPSANGGSGGAGNEFRGPSSSPRAGKGRRIGQGHARKGSNGAQQVPTKPVGSKGMGSTPTTSGGSGSSSPLVPILIAIAALAAASISAVIVRQRRQHHLLGSAASGKTS